jgi:hypothetical protein
MFIKMYNYCIVRKIETFIYKYVLLLYNSVYFMYRGYIFAPVYQDGLKQNIVIPESFKITKNFPGIGVENNGINDRA